MLTLKRRVIWLGGKCRKGEGGGKGGVEREGGGGWQGRHSEWMRRQRGSHWIEANTSASNFLHSSDLLEGGNSRGRVARRVIVLLGQRTGFSESWVTGSHGV